MSRAHPCADDLLVYESAENQLAAQRLLLLQASVQLRSRVRVREAISNLI
jgi:hypothetical protein